MANNRSDFTAEQLRVERILGESGNAAGLAQLWGHPIVIEDGSTVEVDGTVTPPVRPITAGS